MRFALRVSSREGYRQGGLQQGPAAGQEAATGDHHDYLCKSEAGRVVG